MFLPPIIFIYEFFLKYKLLQLKFIKNPSQNRSIYYIRVSEPEYPPNQTYKFTNTIQCFSAFKEVGANTGTRTYTCALCSMKFIFETSV